MVVDQVTSDDLDRLFHALSDATRRDIVARVMQQEQSVSSLAVRYDMSFAAVQKHVAVLDRAKLVSKRRRGREQIVSGNPDSILRARDALDRFEQLWRDRTDRMRDILAEAPDVVRPATAQPTEAPGRTEP
ncbi:DNA-binding transcriptional regulator, ArsR family [Raineyella antarctica]|uniref:DNA-binding transcriptional regulator, ArsR family n=1 Tax=Raineyella antarctica TaxID=1577474 RepID=A0A1G6IGM7_9ACTN|nr:metalloregulator ArsR/SmtB family transcription factor [Raineyella antarctica]SDC05679.1 DNA-binding transcriptional regulator, ArsR family [Raineyella antarctica]